MFLLPPHDRRSWVVTGSRSNLARDLFGGGGWRDVLDDEDGLPGLDEPELTPGDLLDDRWILAKPPGLLAQACVLGALAGNAGGQLVVLATRAKRRGQSAIANEAVHDGDHRPEHQQQLDDPADSQRQLRGRRAAVRAGTILSRGHAHTTVQQFGKE